MPAALGITAAKTREGLNLRNMTHDLRQMTSKRKSLFP